VLVAPPGAGKTTRVPLALLDDPGPKGKKIIVLEPRRIAARASAERMAKTLGERAGETVGYRVRFGSKCRARPGSRSSPKASFRARSSTIPNCRRCRRAVRRIPRTLARCRSRSRAGARCADGLREDLRILVMSATIDGARVASLLGDAPVIASEGRAFPVETRYLGRKPMRRWSGRLADAIASALRADPVRCWPSCRAPAEIRRTENFLRERVQDASIEIVPLFGALDASVQDQGDCAGSKGYAQGVLATSIAETSLTIEGVSASSSIPGCAGAALRARNCADAARDGARLARLPSTSAAPRRPHRTRCLLPAVGRAADRFACRYTQPEILSADLSSLVLDLAQWGVRDPATLAFLDPPPCLR
jgi:ATP-dependent helicase HrpB